MVKTPVLYKSLVVGVIVLFIGVAVSPVMGTINIELQHNHDNINNPIIWCEQVKLLAMDGSDEDWFGDSVSIYGDYAIVGAYADNEFTGSVYIFTRSGNTWTQQAKLLASDGDIGDSFGKSVSLDGNYLVIGAEGDNDMKGSVYIFKYNGIEWIEEQKLTASDGETWDRFGFSLSIDDNYIIIGAMEDDDNGDRSGSAYVFKWNGTVWIQQQKLIASDGEKNDLFGRTVSIDKDYIIIGSYNMNDNGTGYIFKRNDSIWVEESKLTESNASISFCCSVSIDEDYVIIGDCYGNNEKGSAYIFKRNDNNWTKQVELIASDGERFDRFGDNVFIDGDYVVISADFNDDGKGSAYIFKRNSSTWIEEQKLTASDGESRDYFGGSISIYGNYVVIGAVLDDDNGENSGSAYIFRRNQHPNITNITGPLKGKPENEYNFTFTSIDPEEDEVYFYIDWDDGKIEEWIGPYSSAEEITLNHIWEKRETYIIKTKAKDIYGAVSDWSYFEITIPRTRATFNPLFNWFLERFPMLEKLLNLLR